MDQLKTDPAVGPLLTDADLEAVFDPADSLRHVDLIFRRVFGEAA